MAHPVPTEATVNTPASDPVDAPVDAPVGTTDPLDSPGYGTGVLLRVAHRHASTVFARALAGLDIEPRHFGVLDQLARQQPLSQRQLIERLGAEKSSMVRTVDELEARGLVVREPDPRDRRAHAVVLTHAGELTHGNAARIATGASEQLFGHLSPDEHHTLHKLLRKLINTPAVSAPP